MSVIPRAAFLTDTFHEVNGVGHTSRQLEAFARRREIPFLSIHGGRKTQTTVSGSVTSMELKRSPFCIGLDANLEYDLLLMRYACRVTAQVRSFGADLVHITGPGDFGTLGLYVASQLKLPLVISWHTSLHEYAGRRLQKLLRFLPCPLNRRIGAWVERLSLAILTWICRKATVLLAPNPELVQMLGDLTHRPVFLMQRGVDTRLFSPARRNRVTGNFRIGYVGRLTTEKNVRFLAELANSLITLGRRNFEIVIVGQGSEDSWLRRHVPNSILTGVLRGEALAEAYANMDLFAFPSATDTFGNVVLEASASGVPAVVTNMGGPKFLVESGQTGYVADSDWEFISSVNRLMTDPDLHYKMGINAREYAMRFSWDAIFEGVIEAYQRAREIGVSWSRSRSAPPPLLSSRVHERGSS